MKLGPFDFGPRPEELVGKTTMSAMRLDDEESETVYLGEVRATEGEDPEGYIREGKGILLNVSSGTLVEGWFVEGE